MGDPVPEQAQAAERTAPTPLGYGAPEPPRRLRLSTILIELGAQAEPVGGPAAPPGVDPLEASIPPNISKRRRRKLRRLLRKKQRSNITLGEVVDRTAHAGFGFLAAFLGLVSLPFVGLSTPFGLAIAFIGLQMMAGRDKPWLPQRLRRHVLTMATLDWLSQKLARWTRGVERLVQPRWTFMTHRPLWLLIGVGVLIQGIGLALPIPVPGSNFMFVIPVVIYAIGMLEDDGLVVTAGHVFTGVQIVLGVLFSELISDSVARVINWAGAVF